MKMKRWGPILFLDLETTGLSPLDEILEISIIDEEGNILLNSLVNPKMTSWPEATKINGIKPEHVRWTDNWDGKRKAKAPRIMDLIPEILSIIANKQVVIYNSSFDRAYMEAAVDSFFEEYEFGDPWSVNKLSFQLRDIYNEGEDDSTHLEHFDIQWFCAMERFAIEYGAWDEWHESYTWQKLSKALCHIPSKFREGVFSGNREGPGLAAVFTLLQTEPDAPGPFWRCTEHSALFDCFATRAVWEWLETQHAPAIPDGVYYQIGASPTGTDTEDY